MTRLARPRDSAQIEARAIKLCVLRVKLRVEDVVSDVMA
jgi:hypothetical protein